MSDRWNRARGWLVMVTVYFGLDVVCDVLFVIAPGWRTGRAWTLRWQEALRRGGWMGPWHVNAESNNTRRYRWWLWVIEPWKRHARKRMRRRREATA